MRQKLVIEKDTAVVTSARVDVVTVFDGSRGPTGPAGPAGGSAITGIAGENLGGHRMVVSDALGRFVYASNDEPSHFHKVLGMTMGAVVAMDVANVLRMGEIEETSWNWTLDLPVFLSTNGLLTQTAPTTGFSLIVGFPITTTKLFVSLREPITLT